jgi:alpha-beta hydrolase superfamily lysophospholipase
MAKMETLVCSDGKKVIYHVWMPSDGVVEAVLLILHGMAEHALRYKRFANLLVKRKIAVYAPDHRGHGQTATQAQEPLGWFAADQGWQRVVSDAQELASTIVADHPRVPLFLLGHSMGSFLARTLSAQNPDLFDGVIIMGTGASKGLLGKIGKMIARRNVARYGSTHPDKMLDKMSFGANNKKIPNAKTTFDWLSRDEKEVKAYIDDPLCGFVCTSKFFEDLIDGVTLANDRRLAVQLPSDLPMLIISGTDDPVGDFSKGVMKVHELYRGCGITDLTLTMIPKARHELLNETDRDATMGILLSWIEQRI